MPNGLTSLFSLTKEDLGRLLVDLPEDAVIGKDFGKAVTTLEMKRRLDEHQGNEVTVDEHDHAWYIVKFMRPSMGSVPENHGSFGRLLPRIVQPGKSGRLTPFNWVDVDESS